MSKPKETQDDFENTNNLFWFWLGLYWRESHRESEEEGANNKDYLLELFKVLAPALIGLGIGIAGHKVAEGIKNAEISSAQDIASANRTVAQANLLNTFMESLKKTNSLEQIIAFKALKMTLKESDYSEIRQEVATYKGELEGLKREAVNSLIQDIFSLKSRSIRTSANTAIIKDFKESPEVVELLISFATENKTNPLYNTGAGIVNTAYILSEFPSETLMKRQDKVREFIQNVVNKNDSQTNGYVEIIEEKIK